MYFLSRWWDRYRLAIAVTVLSLGAAWSIRQTGAADLFEMYRWLTLPFQPNSAAQEQLIQARTWELQQRVNILKAENQKLQSLLAEKPIAEGQAIAAPIIGRSADHWWQQLTLGRGTRQGVQVGAVVTAPGGLVGRITQASDQTSRVLLITDPTSRIGIAIGRSQAMGILRGQAGKQPVIEFFEKDPNVRPGDVVVTSNLSSLFPADLTIGRIKKLRLNDTSTPQATVDPAAPISNMDWVTVYLNAQTPEAMATSSP